jgi:ketosteroid isomerase-like protein
MSDIDDLLALEQKRCDAIAACDLDALNAMLRDDYVHVYGGGLSSGKEDWVDHISEVPRIPERVDLKVRIYGDTAVFTGKMINRIRPNADAKPAAAIGKRVPVKEDVQAFATQVAVRENGTWQFCTFQMTRCVD